MIWRFLFFLVIKLEVFSRIFFFLRFYLLSKELITLDDFWIFDGKFYKFLILFEFSFDLKDGFFVLDIVEVLSLVESFFAIFFLCLGGWWGWGVDFSMVSGLRLVVMSDFYEYVFIIVRYYGVVIYKVYVKRWLIRNWVN